MEDALVRIKKNRVEDPKAVLILVLMEDALVRCLNILTSTYILVLILVLMEDALVQEVKSYMKK